MHCYQASKLSLGKGTMNRLECINSDMNSVCSKYTDLSPIFNQFFEDSNGQSEILGVCLLISKDASSMKWMIDTFKKFNAE